jgi:histidinol dehydrogenase
MKGDYVTQLHHPIQDQRFGIRARTNQHNLMSGYVKDSIDHYTERTVAAKYLAKNNFIFISEILEHVFHIVNQMCPTFISI